MLEADSCVSFLGDESLLHRVQIEDFDDEEKRVTKGCTCSVSFGNSPELACVERNKVKITNKINEVIYVITTENRTEMNA